MTVETSPKPHAHEHIASPEPQIDRRKVYGRAAGATALLGLVEAGVEAWKHKQGLPVDSVVALDSEHNLALDSFYYLSLAGMEAKRRIGKAAGKVAATAALVIGGGISMVNASQSLTDRALGWQEFGSGLDGSPMMAALGNTAITGYILLKTRTSKSHDDIEAGEHAKNDRNMAVGKALGGAIHPAIDIAAGLKFGFNDLKLGVRRAIRSLQGKSDPQHDHGHDHAHHHEHTDHHGHAHDSQSLLDRTARKVREVREAGAGRWLSVKALDVFGRGVSSARDVFTKETGTGERELRRGMTAVTALGTLALGAYLTNRFGVSGPEPQPQARGQSLSDVWGRPDCLDPSAIDPPPAGPVSPDVPAAVSLEPGSNPWEVVGSYAESLGYDAPNLQEHDALKDIVEERLEGRDPNSLPVGFQVPMPNIGEIEGVYATY